MTRERKDFETIMDLLDQVVSKMGSQHAVPFDFDTGVPLYRAEIHTVRAIGLSPGINVTTLAERMGVTKGAASQTISRLVKKGLVRKVDAADNERETLLALTDMGVRAHLGHERFHMAMFDQVRKHFGDRFKEKIPMFLAVLTDLNDFLDTMGEHKGKT
jgi:DNA-binding MarR family transcriptional regulator